MLLVIEQEYYKWLDGNMDCSEELEDPDYAVWYFLKAFKGTWIGWLDDSRFKRYQNAVVHIELPFR